MSNLINKITPSQSEFLIRPKIKGTINILL